MQKSGVAAEDVAARGKAIKDLNVVAVEILPAKLEGMFAVDEGEVVFEIQVVEVLGGARSEKEWLAETERRKKSNFRIRHGGGVDRRTRTSLVSVGDVSLVQLPIAQRRGQVEIQRLDISWAFDAIGGSDVDRYIKGLVRIVGVVKL